jgi:eukaryotic-like serine/threonine-protein kinase
VDVGTVIAGKLRVERVLGRGGMGIVVVARHLALNQLVAVKVLLDEANASPATKERFLREGKASASLRSEHVCKVHDVGTLESGAPYLVMELLEGHDLAAAIKERPLAVHEAVDAVLQASEAIAEAHAIGIVHRDLKPANLFVARRLDGSSTIKVLDFGIAKAPIDDGLRLTQTSSMMGSPPFMSPEQLYSTRDVDARSDLWAIGVILYQCVSGRLPFPGGGLTEICARILNAPPDLLGVHPPFDAVVMRCLEKDPARRFQTVGELAAHLAPFGGPTAQTRAATITRLGPKSIPPDVMAMAPLTTTIPPSVAMPMSTPPPPPELEHPRRAPMALAVIGAIAIIIAIIVATRGTSSPVTTSVNAPVPVNGAFARALFDHRCADARDLAAMIGPAAVQRAAQCVPEVAQHFPVTANGAMDASTHKDYAQVLSIAEVVLKQHPENVGLAELAVLAACNLGKTDDARHYFVTVPAGQDHEVLIQACRSLGVTLP